MSKKNLNGSTVIPSALHSPMEVRIKPNDYQPSKATLEADVSIGATPEDSDPRRVQPRENHTRPGCMIGVDATLVYNSPFFGICCDRTNFGGQMYAYF